VNGDLDGSFGVGGIVTTDVGGSPDAGAFAVAVQPDSKILAGGFAADGGGASLFALARYGPHDQLDPSFGLGGVVTTNMGGGYAHIYDLTFQGDRKGVRPCPLPGLIPDASTGIRRCDQVCETSWWRCRPVAQDTTFDCQAIPGGSLAEATKEGEDDGS
jgi:hypothetical protein